MFTAAFAQYPSLRDRPLLVTGGASGIGAAMVRNLAAQGARIAFVDRDEKTAAALVAELAPGARHKPVFRPVDVTDIAALTRAIADIAAETGPLRGLVNNAANDTRHSIEEVTPEFWRQTLAVNLDHHFFVAQAVIPAMAAAGGGAIVNMGSASWHLGLGGMPAYVTAKAAIEGLTRGLARDVGPKAIRVNCVLPGFIRTERQVSLWLTPELESQIFAGQCLKELIEPAEVAKLIAFLLSDDSRMCTSQTYAIDGGWM